MELLQRRSPDEEYWSIIAQEYSQEERRELFLQSLGFSLMTMELMFPQSTPGEGGYYPSDSVGKAIGCFCLMMELASVGPEDSDADVCNKIFGGEGTLDGIVLGAANIEKQGGFSILQEVIADQSRRGRLPEFCRDRQSWQQASADLGYVLRFCERVIGYSQRIDLTHQGT